MAWELLGCGRSPSCGAGSVGVETYGFMTYSYIFSFSVFFYTGVPPYLRTIGNKATILGSFLF